MCKTHCLFFESCGHEEERGTDLCEAKQRSTAKRSKSLLTRLFSQSGKSPRGCRTERIGWIHTGFCGRCEASLAVAKGIKEREARLTARTQSQRRNAAHDSLNTAQAKQAATQAARGYGWGQEGSNVVEPGIIFEGPDGIYNLTEQANIQQRFVNAQSHPEVQHQQSRRQQQQAHIQFAPAPPRSYRRPSPEPLPLAPTRAPTTSLPKPPVRLPRQGKQVTRSNAITRTTSSSRHNPNHQPAPAAPAPAPAPQRRPRPTLAPINTNIPFTRPATPPRTPSPSSPASPTISPLKPGEELWRHSHLSAVSPINAPLPLRTAAPPAWVTQQQQEIAVSTCAASPLLPEDPRLPPRAHGNHGLRWRVELRESQIYNEGLFAEVESGWRSLGL